ncbi:hypothetical protein BDN71DRAFT_1585331 [Pleurotus eryngii]|uniref:Uncharacterized protein n=1 Tax=Pleurotus eryngii TaxID=5323 RepID=A0A9P6DKR8_PLEER|nr:hypothetical protein BDN71DRAFT_1585331 [Pleurotus eryngii]
MHIKSRDVLHESEGAELLKRGAPIIGGSVGGFAALVVCLVAVIILSLTGIVYLWRDDVPLSRSHRYGSSNPSGFFSLSKFTNLFHFGGHRSFEHSPTPLPTHTPTSSIKMSKESVQGWARGTSADDFDPDGLRQLSYAHASRSLSLSPPPSTYSPSPVPGSPFQPPTRLDPTVVRFENSHNVTVYHPILSASPQPSIPTITTIPSNPPSPPPPLRTVSPEPMTFNDSDADEGHKFAVHSGVTMRTLQRGTKFVESL